MKSVALCRAGVTLALGCTSCVSSGSRPARLSDLYVEAGSISESARTKLAIRSPTTRAVLRDASVSAIALSFVYRGPTHDTAPLASGELRRQIGLKVRAHDTCNVVYAMWYVGDDPGLHVSLKANPGASRHAECLDHGYRGIQARFDASPAPTIRAGVKHQLAAELRGTELLVFADATLAWAGTLPSDALAFDGPFGIRSDNGEFDIEIIENPRLPNAAR